MQGFNMGRYHPPASLDKSLSANRTGGFNKKSDGKSALSTGPPTVRFEMPFAIWCTNCTPETIIGQGVRFNARKSKVGNYYSSPIWKFSMKHTVCGGIIEIHTDPQAGDYVVFAGGRRRDYGDETQTETLLGTVISEQERNRRAADPFASLEGRVESGERAKKEGWWIEKLQDSKERDWDDVWRANQRLRRTFRVERKELQRRDADREEIVERLGLGVEVLDEVAEDGQRAKLVTFGQSEEMVGKGGCLVASRPLFERAEEQLKINGKTKTEIKTDRTRTKLQRDLQGNTRVVTDPFTTKTQKVKPLLVGVKRKRGEPVAENEMNETMVTKSNDPPPLVSYDSDDD